MDAALAAENLKPILPAEDILSLKKRFQDVDRDGSGFISAEELQPELGVDMDSVRELLAENDISGDALLDEDEYIQMMCPPDYRLPQMSGLARDLLGKVVSYQRAKLPLRFQTSTQ